MSAGVSITVKDNFPAVMAALQRVSRDIGDKAVVRALNKTVAQGQKDMASAIAREYVLRVGDVRAKLKTARATRSGTNYLSASIFAPYQGISFNMIRFLRGAAHPKKGKQLRFKIKRQGGMKEVAGAFVGNKGRTVFVRTGDSRLPITALHTVGIPRMFNKRTLNKAVVVKLIGRFQSTFSRELRAVMKGFVR